jgi:AraC-like DNA-binding protein
MVPKDEWARVWVDPQLDLHLLHAHYVQHAYPLHSHDYYVIGIIEQGQQSFLHEGRRQFTPPGGVILINPGEVHTGEPVGKGGFLLRTLYPTVAQMQAAAYEATGRHSDVPMFTRVRVDERWAAQQIGGVHAALMQAEGPLERESRFTWTLTQLAAHFADGRAKPVTGQAREAIRRAQRYIDERYAEGVRLNDLAAHVALSPYYLLRSFRAQVGMPPHAYLDSVRIRHAERLIAAGRPLAEVAAETGFSSQSHLTRQFKRLIGVTPGQYGRLS